DLSDSSHVPYSGYPGSPRDLITMTKLTSSGHNCVSRKEGATLEADVVPIVSQQIKNLLPSSKLAKKNKVGQEKQSTSCDT
ncbi:unnamed protein product, partial [Amoebophrya sp. A25]